MPHLLAVDDLIAGMLNPAVAADFTQSGADGGLGVGVAVAAPALALDVAQGAGLASLMTAITRPNWVAMDRSRVCGLVMVLGPWLNSRVV